MNNQRINKIFTIFSGKDRLNELENLASEFEEY